MAEDAFDLTELVRSLQRSEGHEDCFRQGAVSCDQMDCPWRDLCLVGLGPVVGKGHQPK
jgi:hypothetical protein